MKNIRQLVGEFGIEKNTLTNFLRREIALDYSPNFMDLSCNEDNIAVAGTSNSKPFIAIYNLESLISQVKCYHLSLFLLLWCTIFYFISEFYFFIIMCRTCSFSGFLCNWFVMESRCTQFFGMLFVWWFFAYDRTKKWHNFTSSTI